ncbi:MAG: ABC transporter permease [Candidatus Acidiferrales bacterium]
MRRLRAWLVRWGGLFNKRRQDRELAEELESHLQMHIEENLGRGMTPEEARRQALIKLGGVEQTKEKYRDRRGFPLLESLLQDVRFGLRMLRKNPGFTAVAVLTLALGIGANAAIFSLLDAVLLRPLPIRDQRGLVLLQWHAHKGPRFDDYSGFGDCEGRAGPNLKDAWSCSFSSPMFDAIRANAKVFDGIFAFAGPERARLTGNGPASMADAEIVSGDYFNVLGVRAAIGRTIQPADDAVSSAPVAVLSYGYWQSAFGGNRSVVGRTIRLNDVPFTVVGVSEPSFTRLSPGKTQDMWIPRSIFPRVGFTENWSKIESPGSAWLAVVARLKPGISRARAEATASLIFRNELVYGSKPLLEAKEDPRISLIPAQEGLTGSRGEYTTPLYLLMLAVGIVLLIACANVAGLLLARSAARAKEIAVRLALGAGRVRVARQLLTESVLLSVLGGLLGIVFAYVGVHAVAALISGGSADAFPFPVTLDMRILGFTAGLSILSGILFGLAPVRQATLADLTPALKDASGGLPVISRAGKGRLSIGSVLVVVQVALAIVVLAGAGLLVRTFQNLKDLDPGFDSRNVLLFAMDPALAGYKTEQIQSLYQSLQKEFGALPGVTSVSYSAIALLSGGYWRGGVKIEGQGDTVDVDLQSVGVRFFETMRIPLLSGRTFSPADFTNDTSMPSMSSSTEQPSGTTPAPISVPLPVVVNQRFVQTYCAKQNPIGINLSKDGSSSASGNGTDDKTRSRQYLVVGVVGDVKYAYLRTGILPTVYLPKNGGGAHFELRTAVSPQSVLPAVRSVIARHDADLPLFDISTESEEIDKQLSRERALARLSGFFGGLALLLACTGLYGLLAYEVTRRTHEVGIRTALGAQHWDVLKLVLGRGMALAMVGTVAGIVGALGVTRFLQTLLFGVKPIDAATFLAVAVLLLLVALLACYIPARRAMRVDPMVALRYE